MTDAEAEALGRRLVACKGFRVMRGMLDMQGRTWGRDLLWRWRNDLDVPDLRDPATLGCVLALVRVQASMETVYVRPTKSNWIVLMGSGKGLGKLCDGATEAEALIAALEAAP